MLAQGTMLRNGTYCVEKQLASGGFGNTYLVRNVAFNECYALKEFFMKGVNMRNGQAVTVSVPDNHFSYESQKEKFRKEAVRLRSLNNPHIVKVHDLFEENGTVYYVMDYIDGESLSEQLKRTGKPLTEQQVRQLLPQVLNALKEVHAQHIWHLDIKPGNIMLDKQGNAFLIDFGASKQISASSSQTSSALCYTPGYAPLEQVEQDMDKFGPWTDFYALGATLYYVQTMKQPPSSSTISEKKDDAFQFPPSMSMQMQQLISWMMKPTRKERPASVSDIEQMMAVPGEPSVPVPGEPSVTTPEDADEATALNTADKKKRGGAFWKVLLTLVLLAGLGAGAWFLFLNKTPEQEAAEEAQAEYEEKVDDCRRAIRKAADFPSLSEASDQLADIEDMDDTYGRVLPEVFNQYDELKNLYEKTQRKLKDEYIEMADELVDQRKYKDACDLYKEAIAALPDDDELTERRNQIVEKIGFLDVIEVKFANCEQDGTDIDEAGSVLFADRMRYLFPKVFYNSLMPEGHEKTSIELYYKVINPDGRLNSSFNSPYGYTNKTSIDVVVGEKNQGEWLNGWGNAAMSTYEAGEYRFELYYKSRKIYECHFQMY